MRLVLLLLQAALVWVVSLAVAVRLARPSVPPPAAEAGRPQAISYGQVRHLALSLAFLVAGLWLLYRFAAETAQVLTLLSVSLVLAIALRPTVERLHAVRLPVVNRGIPRPMAILLIYLLLASVAVGIGILVIPNVISELQSLVFSFPMLVGYVDRAVQDLQQYPFVPDLSGIPERLLSQLIGGLSQALNLLVFAVNVITSFLSSVLVLVVTFFLIMDAEDLHSHMISLVPPDRREQARRMTARMGNKIEGWLKGTLLLSAFIGAGTALGMWALGMPYPLLLGLVAGLFELVPMVGAYLGAAPAVIIALFEPTWRLIAVVVFFVALQQLENNVLAPTVMSKQVELSPLLTIVALVLGAAVKGLIGALLAIPVAAILNVLWTDLVVPEIKKRYGEGGASASSP
ncbi:MAG: AI-2E family transporter [Sphingomonadaceae bacterium]